MEIMTINSPKIDIIKAIKLIKEDVLKGKKLIPNK